MHAGVKPGMLHLKSWKHLSLLYSFPCISQALLHILELTKTPYRCGADLFSMPKNPDFAQNLCHKIHLSIRIL